MYYDYPHFTDNFPNATHSQDSNREETQFQSPRQNSFCSQNAYTVV